MLEVRKGRRRRAEQIGAKAAVPSGSREIAIRGSNPPRHGVSRRHAHVTSKAAFHARCGANQILLGDI